jgi:transposase InsO family protein
VSRSCGYNWLDRFRAAGEAGLAERSRRPLHAPERSPAATEAAVLALRRLHPIWGGRKIAGVLAREEGLHVAPSTVTGILRRAGIALGAAGATPGPWTRFEAAAPNALWQMDFKGHVPLSVTRGRLHPLTILDDHSRYAVAIEACGDQQGETVKACLVHAFRRHGLPHRMLCDNGSPWGTTGQGPLSALAVWLIEQDIAVSHSRPLHPQTMGKDERFHRTLKAEALAGPHFPDLDAARRHLDRWKTIYNHRRPHEALDGAVPADRYAPSPRPFREAPEPFAYGPDDLLRRVMNRGDITFRGHHLRVSHALIGKTVALRPTQTEGVYDVWYRHFRIKTIDLRDTEG